MEIEQHLDIDYQDIPPWRSYELHFDGTNLKEILETAMITEVDQDGGALRTYGVEDASDEIQEAAYAVIQDKLIKFGTKCTTIGEKND